MKKIKFMTVDLFVPKEVFTPRPETELLVNTVLYGLRIMGCDKKKSKILDIGTGSGNVAISLTKFNKDCKLVTLDIKAEALEIAKTNAYLNNVASRIEFIQTDLFKDVPKRHQGSFDVIVSNPPYVARWEIPTLSDYVQNEPRIAIDGGDDGLDFYRKIIKEAPGYLKKGGYLVLEIGYNQLTYVSKLLEKSGAFSDLEIFKDDLGIFRVLLSKCNI